MMFQAPLFSKKFNRMTKYRFLLLSIVFCCSNHPSLSVPPKKTNDDPGAASSSSANSSSSSLIDQMAHLGIDDSGYNSDVEYRRHQKVSEKFFRRCTRKDNLQEVLRQFRKQVKDESEITPISLNGLSSRARILLFRELTARARGQSTVIPLMFNDNIFTLQLTPSLRQPGNGILSGIGTYKEIYAMLNPLSDEEQGVVARELFQARQTHHAPEEAEIKFLSLLNILLDFEVARRLQGTPSEEQEACNRVTEKDKKRAELLISHIKAAHTTNEDKETKKGYASNDKKALDQVPVAVAILGCLAEQPPAAFKEFFNAPNISKVGCHSFPYGGWDVFEGNEPRASHRSNAARRIIDGFSKKQQHTQEEMHKLYLRYFGGASESDGGPYASTDEESSDSDT